MLSLPQRDDGQGRKDTKIASQSNKQTQPSPPPLHTHTHTQWGQPLKRIINTRIGALERIEAEATGELK